MAGFKCFSRKLKARNNRITNFIYDILCVTVWENMDNTTFKEVTHYFIGRKNMQGEGKILPTTAVTGWRDHTLGRLRWVADVA
jgi:hypothetical protein